ncbi:MAG TPA: hypothetical protein EYG34_07575 [Acidimicrobiia bacterium]|jgi:hypothetical protein|nr:hypothetical protein [Acidimicrobiia bacterium]HIL46957.1 hypothetical protein [Acidimicrobiia bacterium]
MVRKASWRLVGESLVYSLVASTIYLVTKVLVERSIEEWRLITRTMGVWEGLMGGLIFVAVVGTIRQRPPWVKFFVPWFLSTIFYLFVEGRFVQRESGLGVFSVYQEAVLVGSITLFVSWTTVTVGGYFVDLFRDIRRR